MWKVDKIFKSKFDSALAYGQIITGGAKFNFQLRLSGEGNKYVSLPRKKKGDSEEWEQIVYPVNKEAAADLLKAVLEAYNAMGDGQEATPAPTGQYMDTEIPF